MGLGGGQIKRPPLSEPRLGLRAPQAVMELGLMLGFLLIEPWVLETTHPKGSSDGSGSAQNRECKHSLGKICHWQTKEKFLNKYLDLKRIILYVQLVELVYF